jgi:hypothetical protein
MKKSRMLMIVMSVVLSIVTFTLLVILAGDLYNSLNGALWCARGMDGVRDMPKYHCGSWIYFIMAAVDGLTTIVYAWTSGYLIFFLYKYWSTDVVSIKNIAPVTSINHVAANTTTTPSMNQSTMTGTIDEYQFSQVSDQFSPTPTFYNQPYYTTNSIPPVRDEI